MKLDTKYNIGDQVWTISGITYKPVKREILGVKTQYIDGEQKTRYSFLKDGYDPNSLYHDHLGYDPKTKEELANKFLWLNEKRCYSTKEELSKSLLNG